MTLLAISPRSRVHFNQYMCDGVRVIETPDLLWGRGRTGWDMWDTLTRTLFASRETWDLVHAFDSRPAVILPALFLQRRGVPLVMDWADWWGRGGTIEERSTGKLLRILFGPIETYFEEAFRYRADGTTVISTALRSRALLLGAQQDYLEILLQGSDVEKVIPLSKSTCRQELGLMEATNVVGYVGTLSKSDAQLLFTSFSALREKCPGTKLLLIGNHRSNIPTGPDVVETGHVPADQYLRYLGACDLFLLPLKDTIASRGRWPSKINDYLAAGRPIVASAVGDVKHLFTRYQIGCATVDNPTDLANSAFDLLSNPLLMDKLGHNAREVAEKHFSWSTLAKNLEAYYFHVLAKRRASK